MKILIVEDEKAAARNLKVLLNDIAPEFEIVEIMDSVRDTIEWFEKNDNPDLIFMDIHLADGSSFEIFEQTRIEIPVIFTTAYDEYALKAFKINSIDYLLKPISSDELSAAITKFKKGHEIKKNKDINNLINLLVSEQNYTTHFLVPLLGDKLYPLSTSSIKYFYINSGNVLAVNDLNQKFIINHTLDELSQLINPRHFFRANRQFIITREIIKDIDIWFNNRLSVNLKTEDKHKIIISKQRISEFKNWFKGH